MGWVEVFRVHFFQVHNRQSWRSSRKKRSRGHLQRGGRNQLPHVLHTVLVVFMYVVGKRTFLHEVLPNVPINSSEWE